jgi:hypothetical protein
MLSCFAILPPGLVVYLLTRIIHSGQRKSWRSKPSGVKAMGLCLGAACKLSLLSERLGKMRIAESSAKDGIEAVRLCAFTPPGSPLQRRSVVGFPLRMNHPA